MELNDLKADLKEKFAEAGIKLKEKFADPAKVKELISNVFQLITIQLQYGKELEDIVAELDAKQKFELASKMFDLSLEQIQATEAIEEFLQGVVAFVVKKVIAQGLI